MLKKIAQFFKGEASLDESVSASLEYDRSGAFVDRDLHIATAILLVQIASADQDIAREEAETVCTLMEEHLGIDDQEIPQLVEIAVAARNDKVKIDQFIDLINKKFDDSQRELLLAMIWKVVLADSKIDKFEERFIAQMKSRLQLSAAQALRARDRAEKDEV